MDSTREFELRYKILQVLVEIMQDLMDYDHKYKPALRRITYANDQ
jgi:hypothetical protein